MTSTRASIDIHEPKFTLSASSGPRSFVRYATSHWYTRSRRTDTRSARVVARPSTEMLQPLKISSRIADVSCRMTDEDFAAEAGVNNMAGELTVKNNQNPSTYFFSIFDRRRVVFARIKRQKEEQVDDATTRRLIDRRARRIRYPLRKFKLPPKPNAVQTQARRRAVPATAESQRPRRPVQARDDPSPRDIVSPVTPPRPARVLRVWCRPREVSEGVVRLPLIENGQLLQQQQVPRRPKRPRRTSLDSPWKPERANTESENSLPASA